MSKKLKLECTHEQFHALHLAAQSRGKLTKVNTAALRDLLLDHGRLIKYVGSDNLEGFK